MPEFDDAFEGRTITNLKGIGALVYFSSPWEIY